MSNNLSKPLFHGTGEILKPGDIVEPRTPSIERNTTVGITTVKTNYHAYATPNYEEAIKYAKKGSSEKGTLTSPIYEVEPIENDKSLKLEEKESYYNEKGEHPLNYRGPKTEHVKSTKGFRVKKEAGWA